MAKKSNFFKQIRQKGVEAKAANKEKRKNIGLALTDAKKRKAMNQLQNIIQSEQQQYEENLKINQSEQQENEENLQNIIQSEQQENEENLQNIIQSEQQENEEKLLKINQSEQQENEENLLEINQSEQQENEENLLEINQSEQQPNEESERFGWLKKLTTTFCSSNSYEINLLKKELEETQNQLRMAQKRIFQLEMELSKQKISENASPVPSESTLLRLAKKLPVPPATKLSKESLEKLQKMQRHFAGHQITPKRTKKDNSIPTQLAFSPKSDFAVTHNLSVRRRRQLSSVLKKAGKPILAPRNKVEEFRAELSSNAKWSEISGPEDKEEKTGMACTNIKQLLEWRATNLIKSGRILKKEKLRLLFSGDKGGQRTKLCISFGDAPTPNSYSNLTIVGIYEGQDDHTLLAHYLDEVFKQIDAISYLNIPDEGQFLVDWFVVGDLSFLAAVVGHYGAFHGQFRSPICEANATEFSEAFDCTPRNLDQIRQQAEIFSQKWTPGTKGKTQTNLFKETKGIKSPPLLNVPLCNYVPSPFHCIQGLANRIIGQLEKLEDENSVGRMLRLFASVGARREAFAKCDFTGNAVRLILTRANEIAACFDEANTMVQNEAESLAGLMQHLARIQTNLKAVELNQAEIAQFQQDITEFFEFAKIAAPALISLPKMHFLVCHFPQFVRQHGFIGLMSEQGTEAIHSIVNSDLEKWKTMPAQKKTKEILNQCIFRNYLFDSGKLL